MKIIIVESRKINHTSFRHFDNQWNFYYAFSAQELADKFINAVTGVGCVWYQYLEFRTSEKEVYGL